MRAARLNTLRAAVLFTLAAAGLIFALAAIWPARQCGPEDHRCMVGE